MFAPVRDSPRTGLPAPATPLIGRAREVTALRGLICQGEVRILVVTGPGGVGKTRLALEAASALTRDFADGVAFVALAPIQSTELVIPAIARALGVREVQGGRCARA